MSATEQPRELNRDGPADALLSAPIPELQRSKASLEAEQTQIVEQIQTIRREGRDYSLRVQSTHEVQDQKEGERRRERIAELQSALMRVQAELGEVNRSIRARKPSQLVHSRERARKQLEERHVDFLAMFHRVASDSLDPRQVKAFEDAAKELLRTAEEMGIDDQEANSS
jgi:hypothetical protein